MTLCSGDRWKEQVRVNPSKIWYVVYKDILHHLGCIKRPATNIAPENGWLGDDPFLLGQKPYVQGLSLLVLGRL